MSLVKTLYYETRQLNATAIYIRVTATFHSTFTWCEEEWRNRQWFCIRSTEEIKR